MYVYTYVILIVALFLFRDPRSFWRCLSRVKVFKDVQVSSELHFLLNSFEVKLSYHGIIQGSYYFK